MTQNQPQTGQKWLFPVGSGSVCHLAERLTEPQARCGFRPQGDPNGVFWVKIDDNSPKAYCPDCDRWLKEHPEATSGTWIPGPPTKEGLYWVYRAAEVQFCQARGVAGYIDCRINGLYADSTRITHHMPLVKPEAP